MGPLEGAYIANNPMLLNGQAVEPPSELRRVLNELSRLEQLLSEARSTAAATAKAAAQVEEDFRVTAGRVKELLDITVRGDVDAPKRTTY